MSLITLKDEKKIKDYHLLLSFEMNDKKYYLYEDDNKVRYIGIYKIINDHEFLIPTSDEKDYEKAESILKKLDMKEQNNDE